MKIQRIDFFQNNKSQYGVLKGFTTGLQKALLRHKVQTALFNTEELTEGEILGLLAKESPDFTAGFNFVIPKQSFIEPLGIPHLSLIVDFATYYPEIFDNDQLVATFIEEDSCGFLGVLGFKNCLFLPHAIDKDFLTEANRKRAEESKRDLDVVMCGSYYSEDVIYNAWKEVLSSQSVESLVQMAHEVLASPHKSHLQAFVELVEQLGSFEKELMSKKINFFDLINSLELYIRSIDRTRILQAIDHADIHIFGAKQYEEGWTKALKGKKRVHFHPEVEYDDLDRIFRRARVVVNSIPFIKRGFHERLLLALSQGASVLTTENIFINHNFPPSLAVLNYLSPNYNQANEQLALAFKDESARLEDVFATHYAIQKHHTWDVRAQTLVDKLPGLLDQLGKEPPSGVTPYFKKFRQTS